MGTPVPLRSREEQCQRTDMTLYTRQLTEEERKYYESLGTPKNKAVYIFPEDESLYINHKMESDEMKTKIEMPPVEALKAICEKHPGPYKAASAIGLEFGCSRSTAEKWMKKSGLYAIWKQTEQKDSFSSEPDNGTKELDGVINDENPVQYEYLEDPNDPKELTLAAQPGTGQTHYPEEESSALTGGLVAKIAYSEYSIGSILVGINFQHATVKIYPDGFTFEEAAAVVELLSDILQMKGRRSK